MVDRRRLRRGRRAAREDDRDAADGGAVQRRRRRRGSARFVGGVPQAGARPGNLQVDISIAIMLSALIGSISFAGSMVAFAKLQELIQRPPDHLPRPAARQCSRLRALPSQRESPSSRARRSSGCCGPCSPGAALFGVLFVLPIGGADMPVVISLLNAFTGLAAAATGFELENNVLIVAGMLVGASGTLADADDEPGDEPLDLERPLRRVRAGLGGRRPPPGPTAAPCAPRARRTSR